MPLLPRDGWRRITKKLTRRIKWALGRDLYVRPQVSVPVERFGGPGGYWTLATDGLHSGLVLWALGVGDDISAERELIGRYGLTVHAFDPTPIALEHELPERMTLHPFAVADYDGVAQFAPPSKGYISFSLARKVRPNETGTHMPVRRVATLRKDLSLPTPDILKMDIEGAEYGVLADVIACGYRPSQILVEFHHRHAETGARKTREAIALLNQTGYQLAFVSHNGMEYTFVRANPA